MKLSLAILMGALAAPVACADDVYVISWSTLDSGGGVLTGDTFEISATIGQPDAGTLSGDEFLIETGYWVSPSGSGRNPCPGDFNRDGFIDFFDYDNFVLLFETGFNAADVNRDGFIDFFDYDDFVRSFETGC